MAKYVLGIYSVMIAILNQGISNESQLCYDSVRGKVCCVGYVWNTLYGNCTACEVGFHGPNCTVRCPPPSYGKDCQLKCTCNDDDCRHHHVYGCIKTITDEYDSSTVTIHPILETNENTGSVDSPSTKFEGNIKSHSVSKDRKGLDLEGSLMISIICLAVVAGVLIFIHMGIRSFLLRFCSMEMTAVQI
ncbi:uncharacterized protein LOC125675237 [Ostrea edulis]|uniref:uncharacterized protein LOC125675237 n=1 Tax=Ostrea edulis TaxID=37623 RepID=UPI0024AFD595|nr:uncharacterized protein LOC125675237 [Ostrea edulis]